MSLKQVYYFTTYLNKDLSSIPLAPQQIYFVYRNNYFFLHQLPRMELFRECALSNVILTKIICSGIFRSFNKYIGFSIVYGLFTKASNLSSLFIVHHWKQMQERETSPTLILLFSSYVTYGRFNSLSITDVANTVKYMQTFHQTFKECHCPGLLEVLGTKGTLQVWPSCTGRRVVTSLEIDVMFHIPFQSIFSLRYYDCSVTQQSSAA